MRIELPGDVKFILDALHKKNYKAYIVGGCVRDSLLHRKPKDWDVTTNATPEEVKKVFPHTIDTGIEHGTVTVRRHGESYEVTTFRTDGKYKDNRHPESVRFTPSLSEDLLRRDFTVNAMAYNEEEGLIDLYGGEDDLENGILKAVGIPKERFTEDALRILRLVRFSAVLAFEIDEETFQGAAACAHLLKNISAERVREELLMILESPNPDDTEVLEELGALDFFYPEYKEHSTGIVTKMINLSPNRILRLLGFFDGVSRETVVRVLDFLKFDNKTRDAVLHFYDFKNVKLTNNRKELREFLNDFGKENIELFLEYLPIARNLDLDEFETIKETVFDIIAKRECTSLKELAITGNDLIEMGMKPGKGIGETLEKLLRVVLDDPMKNEKEFLKEEVKKFLSSDGKGT